MPSTACELMAKRRNRKTASWTSSYKEADGIPTEITTPEFAFNYLKI